MTDEGMEEIGVMATNPQSETLSFPKQLSFCAPILLLIY